MCLFVVRVYADSINVRGNTIITKITAKCCNFIIIHLLLCVFCCAFTEAVNIVLGTNHTPLLFLKIYLFLFKQRAYAIRPLFIYFFILIFHLPLQHQNVGLQLGMNLSHLLNRRNFLTFGLLFYWYFLHLQKSYLLL